MDPSRFRIVLQLVPLQGGVAEIEGSGGEAKFTQEPACAEGIVIPDCQPDDSCH